VSNSNADLLGPNKIFRRALKALSANEIENIISKALGGVQCDYQANLKEINFNPTNGSVIHDDNPCM